MPQSLYDLHTIAKHFNRAAGTYEQEAKLQRHYIEQAIRHLKPRLPDNALIFDAGAGSGMFAKLAKANGCHWRIIGGDIAMDMCRQAAPHQQLSVQCDLSSMSFASNTFDAAICAFALQWSNSPSTAIQQIADTLKPGAPLLLLSFGDGTLDELKLAARHAGETHIANHFHHTGEYVHWLKNAGLKVATQQEETCITYFAHVEALFRHLKLMGASNSLATRNKSLSARRELKQIAEFYKKQFSCSEGIPVSWNIVQVLAIK